MDKVILRRWRSGAQSLIALFPDIESTEGAIMSYEHIGQHGSADYHHVLKQTTSVAGSNPDVQELLAELRSLGYAPKVYKRAAIPTLRIGGK